MNIPDQLKGGSDIKENAGQGFISNENDREKYQTKNFPRRILSKGKTRIDKINLNENLEI